MKKIKFQLPLQNKGSIDLTNVLTEITPPIGVSLIKATPTIGTYNSNVHMWTVLNLPVGATYHLYTEWAVDDEQQAPFTFQVDVVSDQQSDEKTPADNSYTRIYTLDDLYPCPDCPPPSMTINNTTWYSVSGKIDFEECSACDTEITLVADSEVNIDNVVIDAETGKYHGDVTDRTSSWSFDVEGSCINCPFWCNSGNDYGPFGPATVSGEAPCCDPGDTDKFEEFYDLQSGNSIQLSQPVSEVTKFHRNGVLQMTSTWTFNGTDTITLDDPFSIGEGTYGEDCRVDYKL